MPDRMHHTVGRLARATGLTVRTLHHWDEIGLLRPAERSGAGHRRYSAEDVERLYRILALRRRLVGILDAFDRLDGPSTDQIIDAIEVMTMSERHYTPEQLEQLADRRERLGDARIRSYEQEWAELLAAMERERAAGTDPADPGVQALAQRWRELIAAFTGGDMGIHDSLNRMYAEEGTERASRGALSADTAEYARKAVEHFT